MGNSVSHVQMFNLRSLLDWISAGRLGIPEFQRDFEWSDDAVRSLLVTVFSGWPAGSLLLLDGSQKLFHLRPFETGPEVSNAPRYVVLDGQQRLTAVFQAFRASGDRRYGVRWNIDADQDLEDSVISLRADQWNKQFGTVRQ